MIKIARALATMALALSLVWLSGCSEKPYTGPALPEGYKPYSPRSKGPNPVVQLKTSLGSLTVELFEDDAPNTVNNFVELAEKGFYDGLKFHRISKMGGTDPIIQGGDPKGDGSGGPGYMIPAEINAHKHEPYTLAMARRGGGRNNGLDTAGSQFYIIGGKGAHNLDGQYTVFGQVTEGKDVVDKLVAAPTLEGSELPKDEIKIESVKVLSKRDHTYGVFKKFPEEDAAAGAGAGMRFPSSKKAPMSPKIEFKPTPKPAEKKADAAAPEPKKADEPKPDEKKPEAKKTDEKKPEEKPATKTP